MTKIELKRDPIVLIPYAAITIALFVLVGLEKISWAECLAGLAVLNVPAIFGLAKNGSAAALLLVVALGLGASACAGAMSEKEKAAAAEGSYTAEQLRCVDEAETLEESRECRAKVREKWATKDAGGGQ